MALLSWTLYELSRQPDYQARVREEIQHGTVDYDSMPLLNATINVISPLLILILIVTIWQESLHLHPIVPTFSQYAAEDDTIPLSEPIWTRTGETWNEIPMEKGQMVMISAYTYNRYVTAVVSYEYAYAYCCRLRTIWVDNVDDWVLEQFLNVPKCKGSFSVGLHANLWVALDFEPTLKYW